MSPVGRGAARAEEALAVLALVWISGALRIDPLGGEWVFLIAAAAALGVLGQWRTLAPALRAAWPLLLLVALAGLSSLWSVKPSRTERAASALFVTTCVGLFLATRFDLRRQLRIAAFTFAGLAAATVLLVVIAPDVAIMTGRHQGAWQGPFINRQYLAPLAVLGGAACLLCALEWPASRRLAALGAVLCGVTVIGSRSRSGALLGVAVVAAIPALLLLRRTAVEHRRAWILGSVAVALAGVAATVFFPEVVLGPVDRDLSLSGRTRIWELALEAARTRPWLGFGYDVYWTWNETWPETRRALRFYVSHGHSAWVDVLLDLGIVGLVTFSAAVVSVARRTGRQALAAPGPAALWPLLALAVILAMSLLESTLKSPSSAEWALTVAFAAGASGAWVRPPAPRG